MGKARIKWRDEVFQSQAMKTWDVISWVVLLAVLLGCMQIYRMVTNLQKQHQINTTCFSGNKSTKCNTYEK